MRKTELKEKVIEKTKIAHKKIWGLPCFCGCFIYSIIIYLVLYYISLGISVGLLGAKPIKPEFGRVSEAHLFAVSYKIICIDEPFESSYYFNYTFFFAIPYKYYYEDMCVEG